MKGGKRTETTTYGRGFGFRVLGLGAVKGMLTESNFLNFLYSDLQEILLAPSESVEALKKQPASCQH